MYYYYYYIIFVEFVNVRQLKCIVGFLKRDLLFELFVCFGRRFTLKTQDWFYVLFSQSGVMIPEMTDARGRACLVSQRGRRR